MRTLSIFEQHQKKIAIQTLRMDDTMAAIMGGMNRAEAKAFLKRIGCDSYCLECGTSKHAGDSCPCGCVPSEFSTK